MNSATSEPLSKFRGPKLFNLSEKMIMLNNNFTCLGIEEDGKSEIQSDSQSTPLSPNKRNIMDNRSSISKRSRKSKFFL